VTSTDDRSPTNPLPVTAPPSTLADWQTAPANRWTFHHLREVVPTAQVFRGDDGRRPLPSGPDLDLDDVPVALTSGGTTVAAILARSSTDGFLVLHRGHVVIESYPAGMAAHQTHVLMSVSKSIVGCVVGILADRGALDTDDLVTRHIPELKVSGYAGARIRDLLDMRSGVRFSEAYLDPDAEVRLLEQVIGWAPRVRPELPNSMYAWLCTLSADGTHGGPFSYRSCETDVLGWVCERAGGARMPDLLSELLWRRIGAEQDLDAAVDPVGAVMHDGGLAATVRVPPGSGCCWPSGVRSTGSRSSRRGGSTTPCTAVRTPGQRSPPAMRTPACRGACTATSSGCPIPTATRCSAWGSTVSWSSSNRTAGSSSSSSRRGRFPRNRPTCTTRSRQSTRSPPPSGP
jgi:CubicO group peptidase (beta-lactamase class C family)